MAAKKCGFKYVEVLWDDAASESKWCATIDALPKPVRIITRGWLVQKTKIFVTVAGSLTDEESPLMGEVITVPCGCIRSVKELKCDR